jgi:hypothetical protein
MPLILNILVIIDIIVTVLFLNIYIQKELLIFPIKIFFHDEDLLLLYIRLPSITRYLLID